MFDFNSSAVHHHLLALDGVVVTDLLIRSGSL